MEKDKQHSTSSYIYSRAHTLRTYILSSLHYIIAETSENDNCTHSHADTQFTYRTQSVNDDEKAEGEWERLTRSKVSQENIKWPEKRGRGWQEYEKGKSVYRINKYDGWA